MPIGLLPGLTIIPHLTWQVMGFAAVSLATIGVFIWFTATSYDPVRRW